MDNQIMKYIFFNEKAVSTSISVFLCFDNLLMI